MVKAITLHQPWATLVALGHKTYETRSWPTSYRGPLLIHAGKGPTDHFLKGICNRVEEAAREEGWLFGFPLGSLPRGAVVAAAELTDVVPTESVDVDSKERAVGNFDPGRWAWQLQCITLIPVPVPCRGYQKLWIPPDWVLEMVDDQIMNKLRSK